jgi:hypothetical protein
LKPEKYDIYEPIRKEYNDQEKKKIIEFMLKPGGMFFKKIKKIKYELFIQDHRIQERTQERRMKLEITFWFGENTLKHVEAKKLVEFFKKLFVILNGDFGLLTLTSDFDLKNHYVVKFKDGSRESYEGDVLEETGIPGLYWTTILGKSYVNWFGKGKFSKLKIYRKETLKDGSMLLQFSEKIEDCMNKSVLKIQKETKKILNHKAFFDLEKLRKKSKDKLEKDPTIDITQFYEKAEIPEFLK